MTRIVKLELDIDMDALVSPPYSGDPDVYDEQPPPLEHLILEAAGRQLLEQALLDSKHYGGITDLFRQVRQEKVAELVDREITAAMAKPIVRTDSWGNPTSGSTSLAEMVQKQAEAVLSQRPSNDGYSDKKPLIPTLIEQAVDARFTAELKEATAAERAKVVTAVRARAAEVMASVIGEGLGQP